MHSWCSSYLEKRPLGKFGRDETKFKLPLHHLFLILQVHIILGPALRWIRRTVHMRYVSTRNQNCLQILSSFLLIESVSSWKKLRAFNCFCFILKRVVRKVVEKNTNILRSAFLGSFFACSKNRCFLVQKHCFKPLLVGQYFRICLLSAEGGWAPSPPYGQPDRKISVFLFLRQN